MRGRVAVLLVFLVLLATPAVPQCSWAPRASAQFRTTALDLAVHDGFLWVATGYGVTLVDAATLSVADAVALPGSTREIFVDPRGVAYAGSGSRLYVLTRNGRSLGVVRAVDAGGTVNDIAGAGTDLFVGTSNGLAHVDVIEATNPLRAANMLPTTSANVTSVAVTPQRLYAADGDSSVDIFSIAIPSLPQRTGELASLPRAASVHAAGDTVFVSDIAGQNTDVFIGGTRVSRLPLGTNAFAPFANGVHFAAGMDFTLRAVDFNSTAAVKEIYEHTLSPVGGTDFVIHDIVRAGSRVYVAAGDIGLAVHDASTLAPPFAVGAYRTGATSSTVLSGDRAWFADAGGLIYEAKITPSGVTMVIERTWSGGSLVHDVEGATLLTSNGSSATIWSLGAPPAQTQTSTFRAPVIAARLRGETLVAVLADGSVWLGGATPQQVALPPIAFLDRTGTGYTFAENRDSGTTVLHHFATGDFTATPVRHTVTGVTTGLSTNGTRAAVYTFTGLHVVSLDSGERSTIQLASIPQKFTFAGSDLLVLGSRQLFVYENAQTLVRTHDLPANAVAVDAAPSLATVATAEGIMAVSYLGTPQPPPAVPFTSRFYSKVVAAGERAYLFDRDGIEVLSTSSGDLPRYMTMVGAQGILDIAATPAALFTLSGGGVVRAYSPHGALLRQMTINEGPDAQPLAIDTAGNAVWVSLSKGCLSGGCQNKTLVLDPATLSVTASLTGTVVDVVAAGNRTYALFELPNEVRVFNTANPLQPLQMLAIPAPSRATSLAAHSGRVLVIGDRLYEYAENTMLLKATHFAPVSPERTQLIRVDGDCLLITGRGANPETYNAATLLPAPPQHDVPAPVTGVAMVPGKLFLLTTHSLEVWRSGAPDNPKRRAVR